MKPTLCAAGVKLRDQINHAYPDRDKSSDGWVADARHQSAGNSDHIPNEQGWVLAIDVDRDLNGKPKPDEMPYLADQLRSLAKAKRDGGRISYLIFDAKIASSKKNWAWRDYKGFNAHRHHLHCSFTAKGIQDDSPFDIQLLKDK
jgi:hypothetical protein